MTGYSQNPQLEFKRAVIVYNLSTFRQESSTLVEPFDTRVSTTTYVDLFHPTIAFRWRTTKRNFHEIELTRIALDGVGTRTKYVNDSSGAVITSGGHAYVTTELAVRYEYTIAFSKKKDRKMVPAIGFGALPGFMRRDFKQYSSAAFPAVIHDLTIEAQVVPRLSYHPTDRFFLDFNLPFTIFYGQYQSVWIGDPSLPQAFGSAFNADVFPLRFSMRFGMGVKF